jgi:pyruvate kinase
MKHQPAASTQPATGSHADPWDNATCMSLIEQLWDLRKSMQEAEHRFGSALKGVAPPHRNSALNLVHYLALRSKDLRTLQNSLTWLGVSSLSHSESHVMANLDKVLGILHRLTGQPWQDHSKDEPAGSLTGRHLLQSHTDLLLGPATSGRSVRIMVTLSSEAASDFSMVRNLVEAGMDVARINCAHDDAQAWKAMADLVRRAAREAQREVRVLMDLGGPKVRTGPLKPGPMVVKLKPQRDDYGLVLAASRLWITPAEDAVMGARCDAAVVVDGDWFARLAEGMPINFTDARDKKRRLRVVECTPEGVVAECLETYYLSPDVSLSVKGKHGHKEFTAYPRGIAPRSVPLRLHRGDILRLTNDTTEGAMVTVEDPQGPVAVAHISCTMPLVFEQVQAGERIWFDDGHIGGMIRKVTPEFMEVEIVQARDTGENLMADKGINFPDSQLTLPALTDKDLLDLQTVAEIADLVGLSFVQEARDIHHLLKALHDLQRDDVGVVLKIETLRGFKNLPALMLAAMAAPSAGVMIARGDLAVECGFERMAEIQEEILSCSEAAHMPVIWATQVLETLGKTGMPSRAEISDASMGERAECVMLNKGPFIVDAIRTLDDILRRMAGHQVKKKSLLRALRAWERQDYL